MPSTARTFEAEIERAWAAVLQLRKLWHFLAFAIRGHQRELSFDDKVDLPGERVKPSDLHPFLKREDALEFATNEQGADFPYVHATVLIRLCTIVETIVSDIAKEAIVGGEVDLSDIRMRAAQAELDEDEKALLAVESIRQQFKSRPGVKRPLETHEWVLGKVGLGGDIPECVSSALNEAIAVRNVLIHRDGKIDGFFRKQCPTYRDAAEVAVRPADAFRYSIAALWFTFELIQRIRARHGMEPVDMLAESNNDIVVRLLGDAKS